MATEILGISAFYHDSAAAQEERFTRIEHDTDSPRNELERLAETAGYFPRKKLRPLADKCTLPPSLHVTQVCVPGERGQSS